MMKSATSILAWLLSGTASSSESTTSHNLLAKDAAPEASKMIRGSTYADDAVESAPTAELSNYVGYEVYASLSTRGTVLCADNGVVEPYAVVGYELRGADNQLRGWTPECSLVTKEPDVVSTLGDDGQIILEMVEPGGDLEVFDSFEDLLARAWSIQEYEDTTAQAVDTITFDRSPMEDTIPSVDPSTVGGPVTPVLTATLPA